MIKFTTFPNHSAMRRDEFCWSVEDLVEHLKNSGPFGHKTECPWIKLATFGNMRSPRNSLRFDANVIAITGIEGDYDGGEVSLDEAQNRLIKAGIEAIVYTSPSHTSAKPRWRVLAPLSGEFPVHMRTVFMGRLNGALGGILSPESFTLSQSYYYGPVEGVEYEVLYLDDGEKIDQLDNLDEIAIFKKPIVHKNDEGQGSDYSLNMFELAVRHYGRKLKTGDNRRELLKAYMASRSGKGLVRDEVLALVEQAVAQYFDPDDPIDLKNIFEIATHFADKDEPDQPVELGMMLASIAKKSKAAVIDTPVGDVAQNIPDPFRGPMTDIVNASLRSSFKPQPELATLAALISMASCINGEYSTISGGRFNLYGIGALNSGGGKDNPRSLAENICAAAGGNVLGKPASGASLEDHLVARKNQLVSVDEMSFMLDAANDEKAPAHLKDLVAVLLKLYSASRSTYNKRIRAKATGLKNDDVVSFPNPCVSLLGFSTVEGFSRAFTESNLTDGLIGRLLFVMGRNDVRPKRPNSPQSIPDSISAISNAFCPINVTAQAGVTGSIGNVIVNETQEANEMMEYILENCEFDRDRSHPVAASLYARSFEKIERIAGVLAIWDDPTAPVITVEHIEWAKKMVYASDETVMGFVRNRMVVNEALENLKKVRDLIRRVLKKEFKFLRKMEKEAVEDGGCVSRSQLLRVSKMSAQTFNQTLLHLHELGEVKAFEMDGKKSPFISEIELSGE